MLEVSEDLAQIIGCCIDFQDNYTGSYDSNGNPIVEIDHRGGVFSVYSGSGDYFMAITSRQLSNISDYPISESEPIANVDQKQIQDIADGLGTSSIELNIESKISDADGIEYFDGYTARGALYVDENFTLREFDTTLSEIDEICRRAFSDTLDALAIDRDVDDAAGGEDSSTPSAFQ